MNNTELKNMQTDSLKDKTPNHWQYFVIGCKKLFKMKKVIIALMIAQVILFCIGVCFLVEGKIASGIFNTVVNAIFFAVNVNSLKRL